MTPYLTQPTVQTRPELPARVKTVLALKTIGCLLTIGLSFLVLLAFSGELPDGVTVAHAHRLAQLSMIATGASLLELLGVAGVWSFKRWGVYVLSGFSMMSFVFRAQSGDTFGAAISVVSTLIVGVVIAARWKDFE